jgi:hypothetical protein
MLPGSPTHDHHMPITTMTPASQGAIHHISQRMPCQREYLRHSTSLAAGPHACPITPHSMRKQGHVSDAGLVQPHNTGGVGGEGTSRNNEMLGLVWCSGEAQHVLPGSPTHDHHKHLMSL